MDTDDCKNEILKQWNAHPCGSAGADRSLEKESLHFFESVRRSRYECTDCWMKRAISFHSGRGKKVSLQLADASDIPFPNHFFDIVYSHGVLHHTPDTVRPRSIEKYLEKWLGWYLIAYATK